MVTLWRERHGLCKSHFVERNWYMFPAKIFPAEIFPQFVQTQHSRTLPTDQKSKSGRRRPDALHATCSAAIASAPNTINSKHAPIGLLLGTIESSTPLRLQEQRPSSIIEWGNRKQRHRSIVFGPPHVFKSFLQVNVEGWPLPSPQQN